VFSIGSQTCASATVFSIGSQTCASANSALPWRLSGARRNLDPMYGIVKGRGVESGSEFHRLRFCALRLPLYSCAFFNGNLFSLDGFFNFHLAKSDIYLDSRKDSIFIWLASFEYSMKTSAKRLQPGVVQARVGQILLNCDVFKR
jgi:hypothetical protein